MPQQDPNQRRLDQIFAQLDPTLPAAVQSAAHAVAAELGAAGWFIRAHDRSTGVFHLAFSDGKRNLRYSESELITRATSLDAGQPFPWDADLHLQGQRPDTR